VRKLGIVIRPHSIFEGLELGLKGNCAELQSVCRSLRDTIVDEASIDILNQFLGQNEVKDHKLTYFIPSSFSETKHPQPPIVIWNGNDE
jgi:hypothetical protein